MSIFSSTETISRRSLTFNKSFIISLLIHLLLIFGISTTNFALNDLPTEATIYLQCMALSFLIAVVPVITSKAIKIYVE